MNTQNSSSFSYNKFLILDLDNTLIYTHENEFLNYDYKIELNNKILYLCIRPYAIMFLKNCSKYYNLIVWSAGGYKYIECIIQKLFIDNNISLFLYLDIYYCDKINEFTNYNINEYIILDNIKDTNNLITKPLHKIIEIINNNKLLDYLLLFYNLLQYCNYFKSDINNITINNLTIIDNLYINAINNINNAIIIKNYYGNINDTELLNIEEILLN